MYDRCQKLCHQALLRVAGVMIDGIQQESRNNVEGQLNLFGEPDFEEAGAISIKIPEVEEYTRSELPALSVSKIRTAAAKTHTDLADRD